MTTHFSGPVNSDNGFVGDVTGDVTGQTLVATTDYSGDDAIVPGIGSASLSKGSAAAATLAVPSAANVGKFLIISAATAQAHVVTVTGLDSTENTLTFGGAIGDCALLFASTDALWTAVSYNAVTPSTV